MGRTEDPIPMSDFTIGERYSSEDMYRDYPDLRPGDRVAVEKDGVVYTDTIESVSMRGAEPAIWPELSRWQRFVRAITPGRFRKPLKPIREARPATVAVNVGTNGKEASEALRRHCKTVTQMQNELFGKLGL